jgi:hypothetical protein
MREWPRPGPSGQRPLPMTLRRIGDLTATGTAREFEGRHAGYSCLVGNSAEPVSAHVPPTLGNGVNQVLE